MNRATGGEWCSRRCEQARGLVSGSTGRAAACQPQLRLRAGARARVVPVGGRRPRGRLGAHRPRRPARGHARRRRLDVRPRAARALHVGHAPGGRRPAGHHRHADGPAGDGLALRARRGARPDRGRRHRPRRVRPGLRQPAGGPRRRLGVHAPRPALHVHLRIDGGARLGRPLRPGHGRDALAAALLQLHHADDRRLRRLHAQQQPRPHLLGARGARRPALPGHRGGDTRQPDAGARSAS